MNKRLIGVSLILISALLLIGRYITAGITASGADMALQAAFEIALEKSFPLLVMCIGCLIAGIFYLIWAECSKEK